MRRDNPRNNVARRMEREIRHNERAIEERSKTITGFEFIKRLEVFFYGGGGSDKPQDNYIVYFTLQHPILPKHFEEKIRERLKEAIVNEQTI